MCRPITTAKRRSSGWAGLPKALSDRKTPSWPALSLIVPVHEGQHDIGGDADISSAGIQGETFKEPLNK